MIWLLYFLELVFFVLVVVVVVECVDIVLLLLKCDVVMDFFLFFFMFLIFCCRIFIIEGFVIVLSIDYMIYCYFKYKILIGNVFDKIYYC